MAGAFFSRVKNILTQEHITFDEKVVAAIVSKHFPDNRRILNELQRYSVTGKIDAGILSQVSDVQIKELIKGLKDKETRKTSRPRDRGPDAIVVWFRQRASGAAWRRR